MKWIGRHSPCRNLRQDCGSMWARPALEFVIISRSFSNRYRCFGNTALLLTKVMAYQIDHFSLTPAKQASVCMYVSCMGTDQYEHPDWKVSKRVLSGWRSGAKCYAVRASLIFGLPILDLKFCLLQPSYLKNRPRVNGERL